MWCQSLSITCSYVIGDTLFFQQQVMPEKQVWPRNTLCYVKLTGIFYFPGGVSPRTPPGKVLGVQEDTDKSGVTLH